LRDNVHPRRLRYSDTRRDNPDRGFELMNIVGVATSLSMTRADANGATRRVSRKKSHQNA